MRGSKYNMTLVLELLYFVVWGIICELVHSTYSLNSLCEVLQFINSIVFLVKVKIWSLWELYINKCTPTIIKDVHVYLWCICCVFDKIGISWGYLYQRHQEQAKWILNVYLYPFTRSCISHHLFSARSSWLQGFFFLIRFICVIMMLSYLK